MTVCVATLFRWNYAIEDSPPDWGTAAIVASDRMITAGDVQYEPHQQKLAFISPRILLLIAGDYSLHSQAIAETVRQTASNPGVTPQNVAAIYAAAMQSVKRRCAEDIYLAPLGLNTDTFLAQQRDMSDEFVSRITRQLQEYHGDDVEALIVGHGPERAHVYHIDSRGQVGCFDDIGFAAIGIGAGHARLSLMQDRYQNLNTFAHALSAAFLAKKSAEVAPGVGTFTDINLIFRAGITKLWDDVAVELHKIFFDYEAQRLQLGWMAIDRLQAFLSQPKTQKQASHGEGTPISGGSTPANAGANQQSTEASRPDIGGSPEGGG